MNDTRAPRQPTNQDWPIIHRYSRAQALADGVLIDVSPTAAEAGFKVATAVTAAVFDECIEWTDDDAKKAKTYQDQSGRLWDVLYLGATAARSPRQRQQSQLLYELNVVPKPGHDHPRVRTLKLIIGPGDDAEPVATIMLPNED